MTIKELLITAIIVAIVPVASFAFPSDEEQRLEQVEDEVMALALEAQRAEQERMTGGMYSYDHSQVSVGVSRIADLEDRVEALELEVHILMDLVRELAEGGKPNNASEASED